MPFRTIRDAIRPDKPVKFYTAEAGDVAIEIRSQGYGGINSSNGYTFTVGGPELEKNPVAGLARFSGQYSTEVSEGDELWISVEAVEFGPATPVTAIVRSVKAKSGSGPVIRDRRPQVGSTGASTARKA